MCDVRGNCSLIGPHFENDAAIQLNLAPKQTGSQALKQQQYHIWLLFKIKHSKKRQTQALLLICWSGTLPVVVFITHTYNCGCEWSCDYCGNSSASRRQLSIVLPSGGLKTQTDRIMLSPQTNRTSVCLELDRNHLFNKVSVCLFWSTLKCNWCVHTFPNELYQGVNTPGFSWTEANKTGVKMP